MNVTFIFYVFFIIFHLYVVNIILFISKFLRKKMDRQSRRQISLLIIILVFFITKSLWLFLDKFSWTFQEHFVVFRHNILFPFQWFLRLTCYYELFINMGIIHYVLSPNEVLNRWHWMKQLNKSRPILVVCSTRVSEIVVLNLKFQLPIYILFGQNTNNENTSPYPTSKNYSCWALLNISALKPCDFYLTYLCNK